MPVDNVRATTLFAPVPVIFMSRLITTVVILVGTKGFEPSLEAV